MYIPNTNLKWFTIHPRNHTLNSVVWKLCLSHNESDLLIWLWMGKAPVYNKTMFNCTSFDKNFTDKVKIKSALLSKLELISNCPRKLQTSSGNWVGLCSSFVLKLNTPNQLIFKHTPKMTYNKLSVGNFGLKLHRNILGTPDSNLTSCKKGHNTCPFIYANTCCTAVVLYWRTAFQGKPFPELLNGFRHHIDVFDICKFISEMCINNSLSFNTDYS